MKSSLLCSFEGRITCGWERWEQVLCWGLQSDCSCSHLPSQPLSETRRFLQPHCSREGWFVQFAGGRQWGAHWHQHVLKWLDLLDWAQVGCCNQSSYLDLVLMMPPKQGVVPCRNPKLFHTRLRPGRSTAVLSHFSRGHVLYMSFQFCSFQWHWVWPSGCLWEVFCNCGPILWG